MRRKLIPAALAVLASAPVLAQSNVTIYGVGDVTFEGAKATGATNGAPGAAADRPNRTRVNSNSSILGFRGSEALGNGLQAIWQFESQIGVDGTTGAVGSTASNAGVFTSQRDTFVGLQGGFGLIKLGFQSGPYRILAATLDQTPGATSLSTTLNMIGFAPISSGGTVAAPTVTYINLAGRIRNSVEYISPTWGGFNASVLYGTNEDRSNSNLAAPAVETNPKIWTLGLNYSTGPIKAGYAFTRRDDQGTFFGAANARGEIKSHLAGVGYTFAAATSAILEYEDTRVEVDNPGAGLISESKTRKWGGSLKHVMGPHSVLAAYVRANDGSVSTNGPAAVRQSAEGRSASFWTLRYGYGFSKRTELYASYARIRNKENAAYDFLLNPIGTAPGGDPQAYGIGLRHVF